MSRRLVLLLAAAALIALAGGSTPGLFGGDGGRATRDARVVRVVDGDTLVVRTGGREERVRLLGIDTPETVKPGAPVECGGPSASRALERLALTARGDGRRVRLVRDPGQDARDRFDRLLRYVELPDGTDLGRVLVREGWAAVYVYEEPAFERASAYRAAEDGARDAGRGVHGRCGRE